VEQTTHARFRETLSAPDKPNGAAALESAGLGWSFHCNDLPVLGVKIRSCQARLGTVSFGDRFTFYEGRFVMVTSSFDADRYPQMREVFVEKYGQPHLTQSATVQNKMGAQFAQETLHWEGPRIAITLEHYGSKVTEGEATFVTTEFRAVQNRAQEEWKKKMKDSL
jgi:hypothetical protein